MADPVWFWQRIVSPHMAGLASAIASQGRSVTFVAEKPMSDDRAAQGWTAPDMGQATLRYATDGKAVEQLVSEAPSASIHICQGFRGNGLVQLARQELSARRLSQWVIMETVEEAGMLSTALKRLEYRRLIASWKDRINGVLATGHRTPDWLAGRGMPRERVFPFAYCLPDRQLNFPQTATPGPFDVLFVGQFVERKRVDVLVDALASMPEKPFRLTVVGSGPLESELRQKAEHALPGRVTWLGTRPIAEIPSIMARADCLVLPSRHDGWGAVVSEALMSGTPAICSDRCGTAGVVRASGVGGVFPAGDVPALAALLKSQMQEGRQTPERRLALASWARCLGAAAGASYLSEILDWTPGKSRPRSPWEIARPIRPNPCPRHEAAEFCKQD